MIIHHSFRKLYITIFHLTFMGLRHDVLGSVLTKGMTDPEAIANELGCSRNTVVNYLSRSENDDTIELKWLPFMPISGEWIFVIYSRSEMDARYVSSPALKWKGEGLDYQAFFYSSYNDWKKDDTSHYGRMITHLAPFEIKKSCLVAPSDLKNDLDELDRKILANIVIGQNAMSEYLSLELGVSISTISKRLSRLKENRYLIRRYLPTVKTVDEDLTQKLMIPIIEGIDGFKLSSELVEINTLSMVASSLGISLVQESKKWLTDLENIGGPYLAKSARLTGGWMMGTSLFELLPNSFKEERVEKFRSAVTSALSKEMWEQIIKSSHS